MVQRAVLKHGRGQVYTFNPHANTVAIRPATMHDLDVGGLSLFDPNRLARQMLAAGTATESHLHLLPQKSLVGHIVDAVQTDWSGPETDRGRYTLYFDSRTHLFVGLDLQGRERGQSQAGTFRVATDQTMLNSAVPKDTFAFRPPRRAHVVPGP
jgi:hypothetical protein